MDQNNIEYKISVMQAFKEGKQIQFKQLDDPEGSWFDHTNPGWNWNSFDYRVKTEEKTEYQKEVEQAFYKGLTIQFKHNAQSESCWDICFDPSWNWDCFNYRVKQEEKTEYQKEVELAHGNGKEIEYKFKRHPFDAWGKVTNRQKDVFNWNLFDYRIKKERIHLFLWAYKFDGLWRIHNVFAGGNIEDIKEELKRVLFSNSLKGVEDYKRLDYTKIIVDEE